MLATRTQPVRLDRIVVLEEPLWFLPGNGEGTVLGMDIIGKYGFVIHCFEKQIALKTDGVTKRFPPGNRLMSISTTDPLQHFL